MSRSLCSSSAEFGAGNRKQPLVFAVEMLLMVPSVAPSQLEKGHDRMTSVDYLHTWHVCRCVHLLSLLLHFSLPSWWKAFVFHSFHHSWKTISLMSSVDRSKVIWADGRTDEDTRDSAGLSEQNKAARVQVKPGHRLRNIATSRRDQSCFTIQKAFSSWANLPPWCCWISSYATNPQTTANYSEHNTTKQQSTITKTTLTPTIQLCGTLS